MDIKIQKNGIDFVIENIGVEEAGIIIDNIAKEKHTVSARPNRWYAEVLHTSLTTGRKQLVGEMDTDHLFNCVGKKITGGTGNAKIIRSAITQDVELQAMLLELIDRI